MLALLAAFHYLRRSLRTLVINNKRQFMQNNSGRKIAARGDRSERTREDRYSDLIPVEKSPRRDLHLLARLKPRPAELSGFNRLRRGNLLLHY